MQERAEITRGLVKMFDGANIDTSLKDLRETGTFQTGWIKNIGCLINERVASRFSPLENFVPLQLPPPFEYIEVEVGQTFDLCYNILFRCVISPDFQNKVKGQFIESRKPEFTGTTGRSFRYVGPEHEPTIRDYQRQIEAFISDFIKGTFLSQKDEGTVRCPSIRVVVAEKIDFQNFKGWFNEHFDFLRFLGFMFPSRTQGCYLVSYQEDRLFKPVGVFAGLTLMCSKADYTTINKDQIEQEIFENIYWTFQTELLPYFVATYRTHRQLELILPSWEEKSKALEERLQKAVGTKTKGNVELFRNIYAEAFQLLNSFELYASQEDRDLRTMQKNPLLSRPLKSEPLPGRGTSLDVLGDFVEGMRFLDEEIERLTFVRKRIHSITNQCKQYTDFALQSSINSLTRWVVILTAVTALAAILSLRREIESLVNWLFHFIN